MLKFRSLTNVRPTKDLGCQIICAPTEGQFKITPLAAKALDVASGDYLQLVEADGTFYAVKGGEGLGGKLAASNKTGGGILTLSAAAAWDEMGGDKENNSHYSIDSETSIIDGEEGEERTYFPLAFVEKVEKQARVRKEDKAKKGNKAAKEASAPAQEESFADM